MEQIEGTQQVGQQPAGPSMDQGAMASGPSGADVAPAPPLPPERAFVYAIGRVEARFPSLAVEKEFAQVISRADTAGLTDRETFRKGLTDPANRYIARRMCWVFTVEGLETYVLAPRDPSDLQLLIDAVRPEPAGDDLDVVAGRRGPIAPMEMCGGLSVPMVAFDQLWSFTRDELLESVPRPDGNADDRQRFETMAGELFDRIMQMADNAGATDQHRALNYLSVRYPAIYARAAQAYADNASLTSVDVRPSRLAGIRSIVDVIFDYTHRETDVTERFFVRVDVTEEFPFLVSRLAPYYER